MKNNNIYWLLLSALLSFVLYSCGPKDDETPNNTPPEELIIGKWQSIVHREDGNVVSGEGYREFEFDEDGTVLIAEFEEDGSPIEDNEDNWTLDDMRIEFADEGIYDLINITADSMTLEYDRTDNFSGAIIRHSDDFLKQ